MFYASKFPHIQLFFRYFILQVTLVFPKCKIKCVCHSYYIHENWWNNTNQTMKIYVFSSNPYVFWQQVTLVFTKCKIKCVCHSYIHENWWNNTSQTMKIDVFNSNPYVFWQSWKLQIRRDSCPLSTLNMWSVHKVRAAYLCFIIMHNLLKNVICISLIYIICIIEYIKYDFLPNVQCEHVFHFCTLLYNLFFSI